AAHLGALDDDRVSAIERSDDYRTVSDQLGLIRSAEPALITYAYLLAPTDEPTQPRFVADADVLALRAKVEAGIPLAKHELISHFDQRYDVSAIPLLQAALRECSSQLEPELVHDSGFDVSSISAYIPLSDRAGAPLRDAAGRCL